MIIKSTNNLASDTKLFQRVMGQKLSGMLFVSPGGGDIDPELYGEKNTESYVFHKDVDRREFLLIRKLLRDKVPLIGICRGHQLIAAAIGAKLIQDIKSAGYSRHPFYHEIEVLKGSELERMKVDMHVNSLHHQAVLEDSIPDGWKVSAMSKDGIVEAIEHEDFPVISVQWHPEMMGYQLDDMYKYMFSRYVERGEEIDTYSV